MKKRIIEWLITEGSWQCYLFEYGKGTIEFPFNFLFLPLLWLDDIKNKIGWFAVANQKEV
jgi:hypothetical protein